MLSVDVHAQLVPRSNIVVLSLIRSMCLFQVSGEGGLLTTLWTFLPLLYASLLDVVLHREEASFFFPTDLTGEILTWSFVSFYFLNMFNKNITLCEWKTSAYTLVFVIDWLILNVKTE